jgi:hypothetical protein
MSPLGWRQLGEAGERHIIGRIDEIGMSLSRALSSDLERLDGGVWTVAPEDASREVLERFEDGPSGSVTIDVSATPRRDDLIEPVVHWLGRTLAGLPDGAVFFEQTMWRAADPMLEGRNHVVTCGAGLYTLIRSRHSTVDVLRDAFAWGMGRCEGVALVIDRFVADDLLAGPGLLRQQAVQTRAGRLIGVIIDAYDEEGAVMWVKSPWRPV